MNGNWVFVPEIGEKKWSKIRNKVAVLDIHCFLYDGDNILHMLALSFQQHHALNTQNPVLLPVLKAQMVALLVLFLPVANSLFHALCVTVNERHCITQQGSTLFISHYNMCISSSTPVNLTSH